MSLTEEESDSSWSSSVSSPSDGSGVGTETAPTTVLGRTVGSVDEGKPDLNYSPRPILDATSVLSRHTAAETVSGARVDDVAFSANLFEDNVVHVELPGHVGMRHMRAGSSHTRQYPIHIRKSSARSARRRSRAYSPDVEPRMARIPMSRDFFLIIGLCVALACAAICLTRPAVFAIYERPYI
ncbi:hypothetical protein FA15DRAFT_179094 [Coprinopsis marcescibilis]|uniref:Uncharacterized protein n=1 Tax=Coprinopsis marcescibilis TaxID=230819 RepID=A0A5C3L9U6_COPMA|nr:hypothetical protein FA15DRAFT_179094 [Coprinopsis marcescibilis]